MIGFSFTTKSGDTLFDDFFDEWTRKKERKKEKTVPENMSEVVDPGQRSGDKEQGDHEE